MTFSNFTLNIGSFVFRRAPSFRKLSYLYKKFNRVALKLGATPIVSTKMNNGSQMLVDLRTRTEVGAFYRGQYNSDLVDIIISLLDEDSYFLDIGANIGFYTVAVATALRSRNGSGKVVSFEPFEGNYKRLTENISLNGLDDYCQTYETGLSNEPGEHEITLREDFFGGSNTGNAAIPTNPEFDKGLKVAPIKLERLDNIWPTITNGGRGIHIMKIDIEGHEDFCFQGGRETIEAHRPIILMEVNKAYYAARGVDLDSVFTPVIPDSYSIFRKNPSGWEKIESLKECRKIDDVFLVPEEKMKQFAHLVN